MIVSVAIDVTALPGDIVCDVQSCYWLCFSREL